MGNPPDPGTGVGPERESTPGTRRWFKVIAVIVAVLVLLFIAVQLVGGGHQIPQHAPSLGAAWLVPAPDQHLR